MNCLKVVAVAVVAAVFFSISQPCLSLRWTLRLISFRRGRLLRYVNHARVSTIRALASRRKLRLGV